MKREGCFHLWKLVRRYTYRHKVNAPEGVRAVRLECVKCAKRTSWPADDWDWSQEAYKRLRLEAWSDLYRQQEYRRLVD